MVSHAAYSIMNASVQYTKGFDNCNLNYSSILKLFHCIICFWATNLAIAGGEAVTNSGINVLWNLAGVVPDSQLMSISLYNLDLRISWLNTWKLGSLPLAGVRDSYEVSVRARLVVRAFCIRLSFPFRSLLNYLIPTTEFTSLLKTKSQSNLWKT